MNSLFPRLRQLILPFFALPNDPAIIIGPDLPPCMQARYSAAIFFRPPNTVTGGLQGGMWQFRAQRKAQASVEEGYLLYDQATVCGFVVSRVFIGANDSFGNIGVLEQFTPQFAGGASSYVAGAFKTQIVGNASNGISAQILFGDVGTDPNLTPFSVDGKSFERGLVGNVSSTVSSAAAGAAEIVSLTSPTINWYTGRTYEIKLIGQVLTSVANQAAFISVRRNNVAGALIAVTGTDAVFTTVADHYEFSARVRNFSGATITDNVVSTIVRGAGAGTVTDFGGGINQPRTMEIRDIGASSDYTYAPQL